MDAKKIVIKHLDLLLDPDSLDNLSDDVADKVQDIVEELINHLEKNIKEEKCDSKLDESVIELEKKLVTESIDLDNQKYSGVNRLL